MDKIRDALRIIEISSFGKTAEGKNFLIGYKMLLALKSLTWGLLPTDVGGAYDPKTGIVTINLFYLDAAPVEILADILVHETEHFLSWFLPQRSQRYYDYLNSHQNIPPELVWKEISRVLEVEATKYEMPFWNEYENRYTTINSPDWHLQELPLYMWLWWFR